MVVGQQLKMFKIFDNNVIKTLNSIFGEKNVIGFNSNIVGIKYDYSDNGLRIIMKKVPFKFTKQLIITSQHFVEIIGNVGQKGYRSNIKLNMDLPEGELNNLNNYIFKISKHNVNKEQYKLMILYEINRLEEEYEVEIESISFNIKNQRITFRNNGILFADEGPLDVVGEVLCH